MFFVILITHWKIIVIFYILEEGRRRGVSDVSLGESLDSIGVPSKPLARHAESRFGRKFWGAFWQHQNPSDFGLFLSWLFPWIS